MRDPYTYLSQNIFIAKHTLHEGPICTPSYSKSSPDISKSVHYMYSLVFRSINIFSLGKSLCLCLLVRLLNRSKPKHSLCINDDSCHRSSSHQIQMMLKQIGHEYQKPLLLFTTHLCMYLYII